MIIKELIAVTYDNIDVTIKETALSSAIYEGKIRNVPASLLNHEIKFITLISNTLWLTATKE